MNDTAALQDPTLGDGDEDPPEISIEFEPEDASDYPWAESKDQMLRSFLVQTLADADYAMEPKLRLLDACYAWIKDRTLPPEAKPDKKKHLKTVDP